jgi:hypothetical protein
VYAIDVRRYMTPHSLNIMAYQASAVGGDGGHLLSFSHAVTRICKNARLFEIFTQQHPLFWITVFWF